MDTIEFDAHFGNIIKRVKLTKPIGAPGWWNVFIDGYFQGIVGQYQGKWEARWQDRNNDFTAEDVQIMADIIKDYLNSST